MLTQMIVTETPSVHEGLQYKETLEKHNKKLQKLRHVLQSSTIIDKRYDHMGMSHVVFITTIVQGQLAT